MRLKEETQITRTTNPLGDAKFALEIPIIRTWHPNLKNSTAKPPIKRVSAGVDNRN